MEIERMEKGIKWKKEMESVRFTKLAEISMGKEGKF